MYLCISSRLNIKKWWKFSYRKHRSILPGPLICPVLYPRLNESTNILLYKIFQIKHLLFKPHTSCLISQNWSTRMSPNCYTNSRAGFRLQRPTWLTVSKNLNVFWLPHFVHDHTELIRKSVTKMLHKIEGRIRVSNDPFNWTFLSNRPVVFLH